MAGLLSMLDNPGAQLGLGLLAAAGPSPVPMSFGQRAAGAVGQFQASQRAEREAKAQEAIRELQAKMLQAQMMEREQAAARQKTDGGILRNLAIGAPADGMGPPQGAPRIDPQAFLAGGGSLEGLPSVLQLQAALNPAPKADELMTVAPGATVLNRRTGQSVFTAPTAEAKDDEFTRLLRGAGVDPASAEGQAMYRKLVDRKLAPPTPAATVNVSTGEKPLINAAASGLGKQLDEGLGNAKAAVASINTAQTLRQAVDTGKIVAGPGASFRVFGLQVGQMLGIGGKTGAEILANTRTAIQSMAQAELDAAQQMKGQGQITEAERDIIRRAAAGNIDQMTPPEIRQLSEAMEKTARFKIAGHLRNVEALSKMPGAEALMPFYRLDAPPQYQAPGTIDLGNGITVRPR